MLKTDRAFFRLSNTANKPTGFRIGHEVYELRNEILLRENMIQAFSELNYE